VEKFKKNKISDFLTSLFSKGNPNDDETKDEIEQYQSDFLERYEKICSINYYKKITSPEAVDVLSEKKEKN